MNIHLYSLPDQIPSGALDGRIAIVVDVLRASTTIVTALFHGASAVAACQTIAEAKQRSLSFDSASPALLGGERGGQPIDGFDLSNSPSEYLPERIAGRSIVFTTTNGTRALRMCQGRGLKSNLGAADEILIGCFVNLSTLSGYLLQQNKPVSIVCSGTDGQPTFEDILFGGALLASLSGKGSSSWDVSAKSAAIAWETVSRQMQMPGGKPLWHFLMKSLGGKNLVNLGLQADIELAAKVDDRPVLAKWDPKTDLIVVDSN